MNVLVFILELKYNGIKNRKKKLIYGMLYQISVESNGVCLIVLYLVIRFQLGYEQFFILLLIGYQYNLEFN